MRVCDTWRVASRPFRLDPARLGNLDRETRELQSACASSTRALPPTLLNRRAREPPSHTVRRRRPLAHFEACVDPTSSSLCDAVDWQFFFNASELKGECPSILKTSGGSRAL